MNQGQRVWYYYVDGKQCGPLKKSEILLAISEGTVKVSDYVFKEGTPDWIYLEDCAELESNTPDIPPVARKTNDKRFTPRVAINDSVVMHNDSHVAGGTLRDISANGLFMESEDNVFKVNDEVKITLKEGKGLGKPMNFKAIVVRMVRDTTPGYGLELRELDEKSRTRIVDYVKQRAS